MLAEGKLWSSCPGGALWVSIGHLTQEAAHFIDEKIQAQ
jgi:hypothetical protein